MCDFADNFQEKLSHSQLTQKGIEMARTKGVVWGAHGKIQAKTNRISANKYAESLRSVFLELWVDGYNTPKSLAEELNKRVIPGQRGGRWHPTSVKRVIERLGNSFSQQAKQAIMKKVESQMMQILQTE